MLFFEVFQKRVIYCHTPSRTYLAVYTNIYIIIAITLDESISLDVLHFPMKNIKSRDLEATPVGGATSKPTSDVVCLLLLSRRWSPIAMALGAKI